MQRTAPELRYTDRDVREDSSLILLAESYVRNYGGEFDPLVRAGNMLHMDGGLTTTMARTVLNCMRQDAHIANQLPPPKGYTLPQRPKAQAPQKQERVPTALLIGHRYSRSDYTYKCRVKFDFVVNLHVQAKWYHQIDHTRTMLEFYPPDWPIERIHRANSFYLTYHGLRAMCGADLSSNLGNTKWLATADDAAESDNEFCPRCKEAAQ